MVEVQMIICPKCGNDFPKLRKTEYGYNFCVNCSTVQAKVGITTVEGSGDHTWNDIIILDQDVAIAMSRKAAEITGRNSNIEFLEEFSDEAENSQVAKERLNKVLGTEYNDSPEEGN